MNITRILALATGLFSLLIAASTMAQRPGPPAGRAPDTEDIDQMWYRSITSRMDNAKAHFEQRRRAGPPDKDELVLISFAGVMPLTNVREIVRACDCGIQQVHRTIGQYQMAWPVSKAELFTPTYDAELKRQYIGALESRLVDLDADKASPEAHVHPNTLVYLNAESAETSTALAEVRKGPMQINGVLLEGKFNKIAKVVDDAGDMVLAAEILGGRVRPTAIPIDLYDRHVRPKKQEGK